MLKRYGYFYFLIMHKTIFSIVFLLIVTCVQVLGASFPAVAYESPTIEPQEVIAEPLSYDLLGVQYLFNDPSGAFYSNEVDIGGGFSSPLYVNSSTGFSVDTDSILVGATLYDLIYSSVWGYLVMDVNGNGTLDNTEDPWLIGDPGQGQLIELFQLPIADEYYFLVSLLVFYTIVILYRKKKIFLKTET